MPRQKSAEPSEATPRKKYARRKPPEAAPEPLPVPAPATQPPTPPPASRGYEFEVRGPEVRAGVVYLAREDLLEFELRQSRVHGLQTRRQLLKYQIDEQKRALDRALTDAEAKFIAESGEYQAYKKTLAAAYKVDFDVVTYDDQTGRLMVDGAPLLAPTE